jgi:hypothetical protein
MARLTRFWILLLVPALAGTACVRFHGPRDLRRELSESAGVRLEREMGFTVTRSGVWLARWGMKRAEADMPVSLKGIKRAQVGIYNVGGLARGSDERSPLEIEGLLDGWQPWVKVHEDGEDVLVMVRERKGSVRGLVVVVAAEEEWVLVRLKGDLEQILEEAIRLAFDEADRPDLYARSREERGLEPIDPAVKETDAEPAAWEPEPATP